MVLRSLYVFVVKDSERVKIMQIVKRTKEREKRVASRRGATLANKNDPSFEERETEESIYTALLTHL